MPTSDDRNFFTPGQRRLFAFGLSLLTLVASLAMVVLLLVSAGRLVSFFAEVLWPVAVAGILAMILRPAVDWTERRLNGRRPVAVISLYLVFVLGVSGLILIAIPPIASQIIDLVTYAPTLWANANTFVREHYPDWVNLFTRLRSSPVLAKLMDAAQAQLSELPSVVLPSLRALGEGALNMGSLATRLAVIPIYLFFFLLARGGEFADLPKHLAFLKPQARDDVMFLLREFVSIVVSFFRGQILIGILMGLLLAIGFAIVGLKFGLLLGLLVGVLNIIPYLGTIIGLAVCVPLAFFQSGGGWKLAALVLLTKLIVQTIEGWFLTPKIMGERTGLHPAAIVFAVFFWGKAFDGLLGMVLAIPLTAFFVTFWRWVRERHFSDDEGIKL